MGLQRNILAVSGVATAIYLGLIVKNLTEDVPIPVPPRNSYWGPGKSSPDDTAIYEFEINITDEVISDLNNRLDRFLSKPLTPPLENTGFQYGFNSDYLTTLVRHWRNEYDWKSRQTFLNKYKHYSTQINGIKIHFMRVRPSNVSEEKQVLPLLLLHGWPNTFRDFYDMIPILTASDIDTDFVFELVIPSLPGFGFSEGSSKPSFGQAEISVVLNKLMERIGFVKYYVHGGDWGAILARNLGVLFPERVMGVHSTLCLVLKKLPLLVKALASFYPPLVVDANYQHHMYPLSKTMEFAIVESGYMHIQATKPDTIGALLADSPAGLAAWLLEKISVGTNRSYTKLADGGLNRHFTFDTLLDTVMIYWVTNSATTSARLYAESLTPQQLKIQQTTLSVPSACARFPNEIIYFSDTLLRFQYRNLIHTSDLPDGGHFAALEKPKELANDIVAAVGKMEEFKNKFN